MITRRMQNFCHCCAALAWVWLAATAAAQPAGVLLHVSFDADRRADVAAGEPLPNRGRYANEDYTAGGGTITPGPFGNALTGAARLGSYDAMANLDPRRGTVAFFIKFRNKPYGFESFVVRSVDNYYWLRYLRSEIKPRGSDGDFQLITSVPDELYRPRTVSAANRKDAPALKPDTWHHIAIAWDHQHGVRTYVDGRPYASNWGDFTWLAHGVDVDFLALQYDADTSYDELWVFDRALSDEQIASLQRRNEPPAAEALTPIAWDDAARAHRLRELSWEQPDPAMPRVASGSTFAVRQVIALQARAVMNECNIAIDGKLGGGFPAIYGYRYNNGNGLHVQTAEPWDYAVIEGRFQGDAYAPRTLLPQGEPIARIRSSAYLHRWKLHRPQAEPWTSFFRVNVEDAAGVPDKEQVVTGRINEVGFFRLNHAELQGAASQRYHLAGVADGAPSPAMQSAFGTGDRATIALDAAPPTGASMQLAGLRYHHLLLPAAQEERVLSGLRLTLCYRGGKAHGPQIVRMEVRDPALPTRRLAAVDFAVDPPTDPAQPVVVNATLDLADRVVPPHQPLWVVLCLRQDAELLWLDEQRTCAIDWVSGDRGRAVEQHVAMDLPLVLARFAELASPRPWQQFAIPETELGEHYRLGAEMFEPLTFIRRVAPQQPTARAIWAWTHKDTVDTSPVEPLAVTGHDAAPRWALLQRELRHRCADVFQWWIDNRQAPSGEFGDDLNDDTDFIQDYPKQALFNERDPRWRRSAAAVLDACIASGTLTQGITTSPTDPLHAYENGTNAVALLALMQDSDPYYRALALEASGTVERMLMARDAHGRLRFKTGYFGYNEVRTQGNSGLDNFTNSLMLHPAMTAAYLGGHRRAAQLVTDYADGWLAYWSDAEKAGEKRLPAATDLAGKVQRWDHRVRGFGFSSLFLGAWRLTGEDRYQQGLLRWIEPQHARFRGGDALASLEAADRTQYAAQLAQWADDADLAHITIDRFGHIARQRYLKYEVAGDEAAALEAIEASLRNIRTLFDAYTRGEPQNDRIYPPDQAMAVMAFGEIPHERNQTWPRHYVSYGGFGDLAAWVRRKSDTSLTIWLYSFAPKPESGEVRFWRLTPGRYRVVLDGKASQIDLHRGAGAELSLTPGRVHELEVTLEQAEPIDPGQRPDAAVSPRQVRRLPDGGVEALVHNMGGSGIESLVVELRDASDRSLASATIASLPGTTDWTPSTVTVRFDAQQAQGAVRLVLDPRQRVAESSERNNVVNLEP
jgi:hypothetical protein